MEIKYCLCMNDLSDVSVDVVKLLHSLNRFPCLYDYTIWTADSSIEWPPQSHRACLSLSLSHTPTPFGLAHHPPAPFLPSVRTVTVPATAYPLPVTVFPHILRQLSDGYSLQLSPMDF